MARSGLSRNLYWRAARYRRRAGGGPAGGLRLPQSLSRSAGNAPGRVQHGGCRARQRHGSGRRAVITTSGIRKTERAYCCPDANGALPADFRYVTVQSLHAVPIVVQQLFGAHLDGVLDGATGGLDRPTPIADALSGVMLRV